MIPAMSLSKLFHLLLVVQMPAVSRYYFHFNLSTMSFVIFPIDRLEQTVLTRIRLLSQRSSIISVDLFAKPTAFGGISIQLGQCVKT